MAPHWIKIDQITALCHLNPGDECYYAREYFVHSNYTASVANNLISNLKKTPDRRGSPEWKYKLAAIDQFARELATIIPDEALVTDLPPSKSPDDPEYDSRIENVLTALTTLRPKITYGKLLTVRQSVPAAHLGGTRNPDVLSSNYVWCGTMTEQPVVFLVDDLITSGGHFSACKQILVSHWPKCRVIGIFWARAVDQ